MTRLGSLALVAAWLCTTACGDGGDISADFDSGIKAPSVPDKPNPDEQALCAAGFTPCGGNVVGSWKVETVCFDSVDALLPATTEPECTDVARSAQTRARGSYVFDADGHSTSDVSFALDLETVWTDACVVALTGNESSTAVSFCNDLEGEYNSQRSIANARCLQKDDNCSCRLSSQPVTLTSQGDYRVDGDNLQLGSKRAAAPFCVDGNALRLQVSASGLRGVVVLSH